MHLRLKMNKYESTDCIVNGSFDQFLRIFAG